MSRIGLIDLGTNTLRLVVGENGDSGQMKFLYHEVIPTRLGEGLAHTGKLGAAGIERTVAGLRDLQAKAHSYQVELVEAYATAWARSASNTDEMLSQIARLDLPVWVLTGREEALMALEAVKLMIPDLSQAWVLDIGGGSSEIILTAGGEQQEVESVPFGAVSLTENFLSQDPPFPQLEEAMEKAGKFFTRFQEKFAAEMPVVVLGGSAAALGALKVKILPDNPIFFEKGQGLFLETEWISSTLSSLARLPLEERKKLPGMESQRADILVGGAVLLLSFLKEVKAGGVTLCLYSFIHGLLAKRLEGMSRAQAK